MLSIKDPSGVFSALVFCGAVFKQVLTSKVSSLSQCHPLTGSRDDCALDCNLELLVVWVPSCFGPIN